MLEIESRRATCLPVKRDERLQKLEFSPLGGADGADRRRFLGAASSMRPQKKNQNTKTFFTVWICFDGGKHD